MFFLAAESWLQECISMHEYFFCKAAYYFY